MFNIYYVEFFNIKFHVRTHASLTHARLGDPQIGFPIANVCMGPCIYTYLSFFLNEAIRGLNCQIIIFIFLLNLYVTCDNGMKEKN